MSSTKAFTPLLIAIMLLASGAANAHTAVLCRSLFQSETAQSDLKNQNTYLSVKQILRSSPQTIVQSLNKDHLTLDKLRQHGIPLLSGVTRPVKYTTQAGETFLIKSGNDTQHEVVAYLIANKLIPGRVPPSVMYMIEGTPFAVQKWTPWAEISRVENGVTQKYENVAKVVDWKLPTDVVLFDLLIGNMDRARAKGHNYSIYTAEPTWRPDPATALTVIFDHKDGFGTWKLERVWEYSGLEIPLRNESYIREIVNENPQFMRTLQAMNEAALREAFGQLLTPMRLEALIQRRAELLRLMDK